MLRRTKTNLKIATPEELTELHLQQRELNLWSLSEERQHMEMLFCQRINFLLVTYALIIAGLAEAQQRLLFIGILASGAAITFLMSISLWRACSKLLVMLAMCYSIQDHPIELVDHENSHRHPFFRGIPVNAYLGYWIPALCTLTLFAGLGLALLGVLGPEK